MKSIKTKILVTTISVLFFSLVIVGSIAVYMSYKSTLDMLEDTMIEAVKIAANQVDATLEGYKSVVEELAGAGQLQDNDKEILIQKFREIEKRHGFTVVGVADAGGTSLETGISVLDRAYFQMAKSTGKTYISDPVIRKDTGTMNIMIATPLMKDNKFDGIVLAGLDATFLCDIVTEISIGGTGNSAILDGTGTTIAYGDIQLVLDGYNTQEMVKSDSTLKPLAAMEYEMISGVTGFGAYSYGGKAKVMAYTPIPNSNGWSIDISVLKSEFMKGTYLAIGFIIGGLVVALMIAIVLIINLSKSIVNPIINCVNRIQKLADGDLKSDVPKISNRDEIGQLSSATGKIVSTMNGIITDVSWGLAQMADGNFTVDSKVKHLYVGDFNPLLTSMYSVIDKLTDTLSQINIAADQVACGSEQVSSGAQALSQGATQQASSMEELAATINEISMQVQNNAADAGVASQMAESVGDEMSYSNQQMQEMIQAMKKIDNSSQEIGKIIKVIEDIAFQTNILALNAAVEAARAGSAGKGFAVVADEVRNLAGKSAEASKSTSVLIEESIQSVGNGTRIADETAKSLMLVVDGVKEVVGTIDKISNATKGQANSIAQVTAGMDQISAVVQTNSATAEESAASSEELSGQSQMLRELVGKFKLKQNINSISAINDLYDNEEFLNTNYDSHIDTSKY